MPFGYFLPLLLFPNVITQPSFADNPELAQSFAGLHVVGASTEGGYFAALTLHNTAMAGGGSGPGGVDLNFVNEASGLPQDVGAKLRMIRVGQFNSADLAFFTNSVASLGDNSSEKMRITSTGNVGIGTTTPQAPLEVVGSVISRSNNAGSSTAINWATANVQYTSAAPGAITFTNLLDGGSYTLICTSTSSGTFTFSQSGLTFRFSPSNGPTTASTVSMYNFVRYGNIVLTSWSTGY